LNGGITAHLKTIVIQLLFRRRSHPRYQRQTSAEPLARLVHLQTLAAREAAQIAPYIWRVPVTEVSEAEDKFWVVW
jgi:hypothetical protein